MKNQSVSETQTWNLDGLRFEAFKLYVTEGQSWWSRLRLVCGGAWAYFKFGLKVLR